MMWLYTEAPFYDLIAKEDRIRNITHDNLKWQDTGQSGRILGLQLTLLNLL